MMKLKKVKENSEKVIVIFLDSNDSFYLIYLMRKSNVYKKIHNAKDLQKNRNLLGFL